MTLSITTNAVANGGKNSQLDIFMFPCNFNTVVIEQALSNVNKISHSMQFISTLSSSRRLKQAADLAIYQGRESFFENNKEN